MIPTLATTLHQITLLWPALLDLRTSRPHDQWPPRSLNVIKLGADDVDQGTAEAPLRLHILDTIVEVEQQLLDLADRTAAQVQRPAMSHADPTWPRADRELRNHIAAQDAADPRRWRYTGTRTAAQAAEWLGRRVLGDPGPFTPLTTAQTDAITTAADSALTRIHHALGTTRRAVDLPWRCSCTGRLELHGGDGRPPVVECASCGWRPRVQADAAA